MKQRKRILACILCGGLIVSSCNFSIWADTVTQEESDGEEIYEVVEENTEIVEESTKILEESTETVEESTEEADTSEETVVYVEEEDLIESTEEGETGETENEVIDVDLSGGYISLPIEDEVDALAEDEVEALKASLPTSYTTPNMPSIRNQNPYGTCWAFSATSLAELSVLQNDSTLGASDIDFSELHLAYFTNNSVVDPLGGTAGDSNVFICSDTSFLEFGGNLMFAMYAYANWRGAADETTAPYTEAADTVDSGLEDSIAYEDAAHIKNAYVIDLESDPEGAKALIQELGGIGVSYNASSYSYYNSTYNSYYNPNACTTNHAVTIVGWDDNFPKENFNTAAPGDGAWLVRNSWGVDGESYYGYFWMSYYEATLYSTAYAFEFVSSDSDEYYDNNYQYDGSEYPGYISTGSTLTAANIFTIQNEYEVLKAVSFDTSTTSENYEIEIYTNLTDTSDPESGTLVDTITGSTTYQGIYSIPLSKEIYLTEGDTYAVVVTLSKSDGTPNITTEVSVMFTDWIECTASASSGQSFYKSGSTWCDYGASYNRNIRIKAYTNDVAESVAATGVSVTADETTIGAGATTTVRATVSPSNATNQKVTWSSSNTSVATVSQNGTVTGVAGGTAKITATTKDGGYTASVTITVDAKKLTGITLSKSSAYIDKGDTVQLSVTYSPSNTTSDKTVTWSTSDSSVATVSTSGLVKAKGYGYATITATVGSFSATCDVAVSIETVLDCTPVANNNGSVTISWDTVSGVTGYYIYRYSGMAASASSGKAIKKITSASTTSYTDSSINIGNADYCYCVFPYYECSSGIVTGAAYTLRDVRFNISYSMSGGTNNSSNPTYYTLANYGTKYTLSDPTRKGYTFAGWYSDSSYTKQITSITAKRSNITVYAKWTENKYSISFNGNGSTSGSMSNMTKLKYSKTYTLTSNAFKKKGYKFTGWNTKADGSGKTYKNAASISKLTSTDGKTVKLYAQWSKVKYTITYNLNSGTNNSSNPATYTVTTKTITLSNPTRKGYTFGGWYSDSSYKTQVTQIKKGTTGNKTLYAKWTANKYTVQFVGNGATSGSMSKMTSLKYGKSYTLTKNAYKRSGYKFVGWNTKADGSGTTYKNAASIKNLTSTNGKTVKLYAQWKKK